MKEKNTYTILKELFRGGLNPETQQEIRRWFFRESGRSRKDKALQMLWQEELHHKAAVDPQVHSRFAALCRRIGIPVPAAYAKIHRRTAPRRILYRVAAAAAVFAFGIAGFSVYRYVVLPGTEPTADRFEMSHAGEAPRMIQLPCGSRIWIRGESRIGLTRFPREVILDGEACFSIEPNGEPFIVHAGRGTVKVLGTVFSIREKEKDATFTVDLFEGSVEVNADGGTIPLKKDDRFRMDTRTGNWGVESMVRNTGYPDWVQMAMMSADGIAFDDILRIISRTYGLEVVNNRPDLDSGRYFFTLTDDMSVADAMNTLSLLNNDFTYRIEGGTLTID